jgi:F-type H+-transporting ATPase subunit epsilon
MAESFQLEIVTPDKLVVKDSAEEMQIPGKHGYLGILPGHAPLITELAVGQISYRNGSETHFLCVAWGFAEVLPDKVTILAETAERAEDVDCNRAQKAKERAEKRLASNDPDVDVQRAQGALARAVTRLEVAEKEGRRSQPVSEFV